MILIDSCEIEFQRGLNILSGETGAGKTILIQAIALILGKKTDPSVIRNKMDRAVIEAAFEIKGLTKLHAILNASGITFDPDEYLLIKREIPKSGNNRTFINSQMVSLALLVQIGEHLLELVGQSYGFKLKSNETQRETLDIYAKLQKEINQYQLLYMRKTALETSLSKLNEEKERSKRELDGPFQH